ncbi:MAG TPA: type III pantothenate kinase, partial [Ruminococcaceae bacterium]|nr:type III pantothenate kinase [Oscillospiraceae bacterium]
NLIGRNSGECMQSGLIYGSAAMLDGIAERLERQLHEPPTLVATGGLANLIAPHC